MMLMLMLDVGLVLFKFIVFEGGRVCLTLRQTLLGRRFRTHGLRV